MWLLNSKTLLLEDFIGGQIPPYAILSHRWQDEEVLFQDIQTGQGFTKLGYMKIKGCCVQAQQDGIEYVWIDTCCIDKTSSAELSESINSMYRWYQNAFICYVYLYDVGDYTSGLGDERFSQSAWFTRVWTLQELIAPEKLIFYNHAWVAIGTNESLRDQLSAITGIEADLIWATESESVTPEDYSIAKRMSWAANRVTSRAEDMAYSLLGIFNVYMPMLYGEGDQAFIRLQEEIMKNSNDHSLFAWSSPLRCQRGLLAKSPAAFSESSRYVASKEKLYRSPYSVTNMGLSLQLQLQPCGPGDSHVYMAALDCEHEKTAKNSRVGIYLKKLSPNEDQYARVSYNEADLFNWVHGSVSNTHTSTVYIRQSRWGKAERTTIEGLLLIHGIWIRTLPKRKSAISGWYGKNTVVDRTPDQVSSLNKWSHKERILEMPKSGWGTAGALWFTSFRHCSQIKFGFDVGLNPVCLLAGDLWAGSGKCQERVGLEEDMDTKWIDLPSPGLCKGDVHMGMSFKRKDFILSMKKENHLNKLFWVVDIVHPITN